MLCRRGKGGPGQGAAIAAVAVALTTVAPAEARERHAPIASVPVHFRVANSNTSALPCASDGRAYTVRGHLTGPRRALAHPRAVAVYLFGYDAGEWNWRLRAVRGYDHAAQMARRGHVSLTIDQLGWGASDRPDGMATCVGAQADMAHQLVAMLMTGRYAASGRRAPRFSRVLIAGHDIGGLIAEIEAYSYRDVDGLIQVTWADQGFTPWIVQRATVAAFDWCATDAGPSASGEPAGYHHYTASRGEFRRELFFRPDPRVLDAAGRLRSRNPCGVIRSAPQGASLDKARAPEITVPVLVMFGAEDTLVWTRDGQEAQEANFSESRDTRTVFVPRAGHFPMLERTAPLFRDALASWLTRHGA
ncbi:MAG TPA: alpha/beta hydrolase [Thermoleophilaceae bacterium]|nr:alpha/beta hydrolase [Thermoleophilaceae bacterium]